MGRNIQIEYRWLSDTIDRTEAYAAAELTALKAEDVLATKQHAGGEGVAPENRHHTDRVRYRH